MGICLVLTTISFPISKFSATAITQLYDPNNPQFKAEELYRQAEELFKQKNFRAAFAKYEAALSLYREASNQDKEATCLFRIGNAKLSLSDIAGSIDALKASQKIWRDSNNIFMDAVTSGLLGIAYQRSGNTEQATLNYKYGIDIVEKIIKDEGVKAERFKILLAEFSIANTQLVDILVKTKRYQEAFNYAERAKARAFLDQFAHGKINFRAGIDTDLAQEWQSNADKITQLRNNYRKIPTTSTNQTPNNQEEKQRQQLWYEIQERSPKIASLLRVDVASLGEIQKLLDPDVTLVDYFFASDDTLIAFIVTRSGFKVIPIKIKYKDLEDNIRDILSFANIDKPASATPVLKELYTTLISPLKPYLTTRTVGIVPHRVLHYLPFAALTKDGKHYLNDDYNLFSLPNSSILHLIPSKKRNKNKTGKILAVAYSSAPKLPPLEFTTQEVKAISKSYGRQVEELLNSDATEANIVQKAKNAEIIHIAAHGLYEIDEDIPISSRIYLEPNTKDDGYLEVHEIYELDLTQATTLVVLSACQTQKGKLGAGDEVTALNRAFLYAGSLSVIASLWTVKDDSTAYLMGRFYEHLKKDDVSKAEALSLAQQDTRKKYPHPYNWAAFVLTGDWSK